MGERMRSYEGSPERRGALGSSGGSDLTTEDYRRALACVFFELEMGDFRPDLGENPPEKFLHKADELATKVHEASRRRVR